MLVQRRHGFRFWQILSDETVGVFIGATLPGVMRGGEVELNTGFSLNVFVAMEFRAIVGSDRLNAFPMALDNLQQSGVKLVGGSGFELADEGVSCFSFDQGDDTIPASLGEHGVDFPMPEGLPGFDVLRAF